MPRLWWRIFLRRWIQRIPVLVHRAAAAFPCGVYKLGLPLSIVSYNCNSSEAFDGICTIQKGH